MDSKPPRTYQYFAATNQLAEVKNGQAYKVNGEREWDDGWELVSRHGKASLVKYLDEDYENSIQMTFAQDLYHEAISVFVVLTEPVGPKTIYGTAPGLCGGGGQAQLQAASEKISHPDIPVVLRTGGVGRNLGYPCQKCKTGLGFVGAMCNCHEWAVPASKQLFSSTFRNKFEHTSKVHKMSQAGVATARTHCNTALLSHPAGKAFYKGMYYKRALPKKVYSSLKRMFDEDIDDCALDRVAGIGLKGGKVNRKALVRSFCWTAALQTPRNKNGVMCSLVKKCLGDGLTHMPQYMDKRRKKHNKCK
jgi:hypothetical protein